MLASVQIRFDTYMHTHTHIYIYIICVCEHVDDG